jgi:hypothetical protein
VSFRAESWCKFSSFDRVSGRELGSEFGLRGRNRRDGPFSRPR